MRPSRLAVLVLAASACFSSQAATVTHFLHDRENGAITGPSADPAPTPLLDFAPPPGDLTGDDLFRGAGDAMPFGLRTSVSGVFNTDLAARWFSQSIASSVPGHWLLDSNKPDFVRSVLEPADTPVDVPLPGTLGLMVFGLITWGLATRLKPGQFLAAGGAMR